jgi:CheY-like chemotaxis protein
MLYVEDNPANQLLVDNIMAQRPGMRLLTATTAEQGIAMAQKHLPDIILMDINLPGLNGIEAFKRLTETSATAHIPIIALSANALTSNIEMCLKLGFFRYLTKPIKLKEFLYTIDAAIAFANNVQLAKQTVT